MQNLDQRRAAHAIDEASKTDRASVAKLPGMILTNGLLATLAFATEEGKEPRKKMRAAADSIAQHLTKTIPEIGGASSGQALGTALAKGSDLTLQRATTEALAYLVYLKRYAAPKQA
jgi:CRISPR type III-B/RAMP module-associated protein Cmr5